MTADRDLGATRSYDGVPAGQWLIDGTRKVFYADVAALWGMVKAYRALRRIKPDVYYLNSLWEPRFSILPIILIGAGLLPRRPMVLAPRGELAPVALQISPRRKRVVGSIIKVLLRRLRPTWHATSADEARDIVGWAGENADVVVLPNLATPATDGRRPARPTSDSHSLRVLFLSRISFKKNLHGAIESLSRSRSRIDFRIVGPIEDPAYADRCRAGTARLPANVTAEWVGEIHPTGTPEHLQWADLLLLPTMNENFGHVISEALATGCPVLASTATPWTDLLTESGLTPVPWTAVDTFARRIDQVAEMSIDEREMLRVSTLAAYRRWLRQNSDTAARTVGMFLRAAEDG